MAPRRIADATTPVAKGMCEDTADTAGPDGSKTLSPLAQKVPKVKPTADQHKFQQLQMERNQLVKIIDTLQKRPSLIMKTWSWLQDEADGSNKSPASAPTTWPESYTYIGKLPKYWMAEMISRATDNDISTSLLETMDSQNPEVVGQLFRMALQVSKNDPLPRAALDKRVCLRMCLSRYETVGKRLHGWRTKYVSPNGTVNWLQGGVCCPVCVQGRIVQVRHLGGDAVDVPDYLNISGVFQIRCAWDDAEATFTHGLAAYRIMDMFPEGSGPKKYKLGKKAVELKALAEDMKKRIIAEESSASLGAHLACDAEEFGKDKAEERKRAALEKARAAVKRAKISKQEAEVVPLAGLEPEAEAAEVTPPPIAAP